jgi:hypothetical protein
MTRTQDFLSECFAPTNNLKHTYVVFLVKYFYWTGALGEIPFEPTFLRNVGFKTALTKK